MTKKQKQTEREAWDKALPEGRIIRYGSDKEPSFRGPFPTREHAESKVKELRSYGIRAEVIFNG
jgi:hypothetical protein